MKKKFSTAWKSSTQPRKQRKYLHNAPLHLRGKMLTAMVSEAIEKKNGLKRLRIRVGDKVKVMRGKFKGKDGKVDAIDLKKGKIKIVGFEVLKKDGSKAKVPVHASNVMIIEAVEDKDRLKRGQ